MSLVPLYILLLSTGLAATSTSCARLSSHPREECPLYTGLEPVRVNPAGALNRHLRVEVALRVCPAETGLAEIQRKRIELKHDLLVLLSSKTEAELNHPLRVENIQQEIQAMINQKLLKKSRVVQVLITGFELE